MTAADRSKPASANPDFEAAVRESFAAQGLMATLGARLASVEPGRVVIEMPFSNAVSQQQGLFHGGAIGAIGDTAGGYAALSLMPAGSEGVTVEYKINFMRPAMGRLVRADGRILGAAGDVHARRVRRPALTRFKAACRIGLGGSAWAIAHWRLLGLVSGAGSAAPMALAKERPLQGSPAPRYE